MKLVKHVLGFVAVLGLHGVFAGNCGIDRGQMQDQIQKYDSISTTGCPTNMYGWGINKVSHADSNNDNTCSATCYYAKGAGSEGVKCNWVLGDWGNTLTCH